MDTITIVALALLLYGFLVAYIALVKPSRVWKLAKIQGFVQILSESGTVLFFLLVALVSSGLGLYLLVR